MKARKFLDIVRPRLAAMHIEFRGVAESQPIRSLQRDSRTAMQMEAALHRVWAGLCDLERIYEAAAELAAKDEVMP